MGMFGRLWINCAQEPMQCCLCFACGPRAAFLEKCLENFRKVWEWFQQHYSLLQAISWGKGVAVRLLVALPLHQLQAMDSHAAGSEMQLLSCAKRLAAYTLTLTVAACMIKRTWCPQHLKDLLLKKFDLAPAHVCRNLVRKNWNKRHKLWLEV